MEHRFIKPSDGFVHSIAICRQRVIGCSVDELMTEMGQNSSLAISSNGDHSSRTCLDEVENGHGPNMFKQKPPIPPEIEKWIEYNDLSSKALRE